MTSALRRTNLMTSFPISTVLWNAGMRWFSTILTASSNPRTRIGQTSLAISMTRSRTRAAMDTKLSKLLTMKDVALATIGASFCPISIERTARLADLFEVAVRPGPLSRMLSVAC